MASSELQHDDFSLTRWPVLAALSLAGFILALFGTYWDDAWHTEEGRDTFFIPPHLVLYAGISLTGAGLGLWGLLAARVAGLRQAISHPPLALGLVGVAVTLAAAPIDNVWHEAFGRDSVVWSPPHMLGVAGSALIASALLLELGSSARGRIELVAAVVAGAAVVGVAAIPVLEYETDVPQFDVAFYLPILSGGIAFAFGLVKLALPLRWAATWSAAAYTTAMTVIALILLVGDRATPLIPLLIVPAVAFDLARRLPLLVRAGVITAAVYLSYLPYLNWLKSDIYLDPGAVAVGLPLAFIGATAGLALTSDRARSRPGTPRTVWVSGATAMLLLLLSASALGHDPGQGEELTMASIRADVDDDRATLSVVPASHCEDLEPARLTARRAGETITAELAKQGTCQFVGSVTLPERGRWFLYAELRHEGRPIETWLPAHAGSSETVTEENRSVYAPPEVSDPPTKLVSGALIYTGLAATLFLIPFFYRRLQTSVADLTDAPHDP